MKARCTEAGLDGLVRFVGAQDNPYPYMSACDIYVQTSRIEGFCTTTAEAKLLNKPVVCTDTSGAEEQFDNGQTGSSVPPTVDGLCNEIARLIDSPKSRKLYQLALRSQPESVSPHVASFLD